MTFFPTRAAHAIAAAGMAVALIGAMPCIASRAAEKPPASAESPRDEKAQQFAQHIQSHLDALAARLEIKASQEPAWQAFSAAYRELLGAAVAQREAAGSGGAEQDAAAMARKRADWAAEQAQRLARVADATARLQQSLGADQRLVLNEVARHFAQEHMGHGPMIGYGHAAHDGHCDGEGHGPWEHHLGGRGAGMGMGGMAPYVPDGRGGPESSPVR